MAHELSSTDIAQIMQKKIEPSSLFSKANPHLLAEGYQRIADIANNRAQEPGHSGPAR